MFLLLLVSMNGSEDHTNAAVNFCVYRARLTGSRCETIITHHSMYKKTYQVFFKKHRVFAHFFGPISAAMHQRLLQ